MIMTTLSALNVDVQYAGSNAISSVNLTLNKGEWLGLLGPNGSGKSTLLRALAKLTNIHSGSLFINDNHYHDVDARSFAKRVAVLPQQQSADIPITVEAFVALGRTPHQPWWKFTLSNEDQKQIHQALEMTDMLPYKTRLLSNLSGGERQRVFIAMALAQNTDVLLLDEPTTFLDVNYQLEILDLLKHLNIYSHKTILTVLHDIDLAARYCDRIALLKHGKLIAIDNSNHIVESSFLESVFAVEFSRTTGQFGQFLNPVRPMK